VQNLGLGNASSGVITGLAKRRQCWVHQAASLLASLSGVNAGPAKQYTRVFQHISTAYAHYAQR